MDTVNIIDENGNAVNGIIENKKINFNYKDYRLRDFFDKEVKGIKKRFKFHHFNYYGFLSDNYILAFAVVDLGYIRSIFIYLYDFNGKFLMKTEKKILPLSKKLRFPANLDNYTVKYKSKDGFLVVTKDFFDSLLSVSAEFKNLTFNFNVNYGIKNSPLKVVIPAGHNGWTFTEKCSNINDFNEIYVNYKGKELDFTNASLVYDWSGGYLKRETNWVWVSFSGISDNNSVGANFAAMVNETYETENIYWINKKAFKKGAILFNYDKDALYNSWKISNADKTVEIEFFPRDEINDNTNMYIVKNSFRQFMGKFSGYVLDENNKKVEFRDITGVAEIHKALW